MAQCHGTVTVMYCLCIGVCVHLFQTTALQEGTAAAQHHVCQPLVDLGEPHLPGMNSYIMFLKSGKMAALYRRHNEIRLAKRTFTFL